MNLVGKYIGKKVGKSMSLTDKIIELCSYDDEQEWFEFKENWFQPEELGEYVSALSNAAAFHYQEMAYFIWGVNDDTHEIVGTNFNQYCDYNKEPYQNYLARNLSPSINFSFEEVEINGKRVVALLIPPATEIPTSFRETRFIRIGSSKNNIKKYPKREIQLFKILDGRIETIETIPAKYQDLTFNKLFGYYGSKGIVLKEETFEKNLKLRNKDGEYNMLAQLLSDNSHIPLRVSIFEGKTKSAPLFSVREFGNNCILYSLDSLLQYGDVLNIIQADETDRVVERKEVPLFDNKAFREAIINAVLHNYWASGNEPMISVYSDRIEILSRGTLAPAQTMEGFYLGESVPVNEKLSEIFLQLHISEKSGRGVPTIIDTYGKDAITFRENSIVVTIPFNRLNEVGKKVGKKVGNSDVDRPILNPRRQTILLEIEQNPYITKHELAEKIGISTTAIDNNISYLRQNGFVDRVGKTKGGYWRIIEE
ncbi:RNA-binding domain-containing protein [Butyrivibrio sp. MC2013]|uniref:RNA-binding domain-containing protein n=1 Tax=Butyrivibrio sp. MC2013 TaxID=1280686 RepID=UPI001FA75EAC|nr:RNA-binding domain-containing protein [Butyrivibrio sp. MC2013]